jgi:leucyl-tRNA synthetase
MELVNVVYGFCEKQDLVLHTSGEVRSSQLATIETRAVLREALEVLVLMLSPFTPHLCEELWERMGHTAGVGQQDWPTFDDSVAQADEIVIPVQVNGKLRGRLTVPADVSEEVLQEAALTEETVRAHTANKTILRVVVVKRKLVNIVVR